MTFNNPNRVSNVRHATPSLRFCKVGVKCQITLKMITFIRFAGHELLTHGQERIVPRPRLLP